MYTDRKGYQCLMGSKIQERLEIDHSRAFIILWRIQVSMKIKSFGWTLFLNRCATKDQLKKEVCIALLMKELVSFVCNLKKI